MFSGGFPRDREACAAVAQDVFRDPAFEPDWSWSLLKRFACSDIAFVIYRVRVCTRPFPVGFGVGLSGSLSSLSCGQRRWLAEFGDR
jgi:hypothetical protein